MFYAFKVFFNVHHVQYSIDSVDHSYFYYYVPMTVQLWFTCVCVCSFSNVFSLLCYT